MADLKAQLEITADASGVETGVNKAKRSLKDLGATASSTGRQAADSIGSIGDGGKQASQKVDSATKNMIGSIQRQIAIMEAGSKSGAEYYRVLASQRGIDTNSLKPYLDQLDVAAAKQVKTGISAGQMSAALRGVPAQFTDIATSLQAGQSPLTVFLQQGGQLKDMFGGIGPAAKALGGYVASLINPFTIAAAAAGGLALAYYQGSKEASNYAKALILTGNAAGTTAGQLQDMAARIDGVTGTQAAAAAALAEFAGNGNIAAQSIERFTTIALKMERETGQAVKDTVEQFAELGKSPVEASIKLNEKTRFLTLAIYQQIKALEDQGRTAEAAALAQNSFADVLESRTREIQDNLKEIDSGWRRIKDSAKEAWDAMLNLGRPVSLEEQLAAAQANLAGRLERGAPRRGTLNSSASYDAANQAIRDNIADLQRRIGLQSEMAAEQKKTADQVKARIAFDKDVDKHLSNAVKMEREIAEARNRGLAAGASQVEIEKLIGQIRDKYKDKGSARAGLQIDKAQLGADIDAIKSANEQLIGSYTNAEKIVESLHSARLISDSQYFESKRGFIRLETEAKEDALKKEIERLGKEKLSGKEKIDNDKKIADAEAKIAILRANSSAQLVSSGIQETAALDKIAKSYEDARQAAQSYLDTVARQNAREVDGVGRGTAFRSEQAGRNQIEDKFTGQRQGLERDKRNGQIDQTQFDTYLQIAQDTYQKELEAYDKRTVAIKEKQADWSLGASEALQNYLDGSRNVFQQTESLVSNAFKGMEDALANFAATGKLSFSDLARSILADMARIQAKQALSSIFGGMSGGGWGSWGASNAGVSASTGLSLAELASSFDGGGYTGSGSRSGGIDGKGGFPAILHPQETVVDHTKGQSIGGKRVDITYSPVINIDSRTDRAEVHALVSKAVQQGNAKLVDDLQRAGAI